MPNIPVTSKPRLPICRICWEHMELETGKTDENGQPINEPYAQPCLSSNCHFPQEITIPKDHYLLLGDNRDLEVPVSS